ncbi:hypothetical protein AB3N04_00890 (plasmid) [Alkalihalophilus sp. As8PL]|uniref:Uncharacterized protein n=1 Tax=Alkalihalophilus sp. As8PL TaxID=3237103 RepID=A0AB39BMR0_9BACI
MVNAGVMMESFFRNKSYGRLKASEKLADAHYNVVKEKLKDHESRVHQFDEMDCVVRWIRKAIYQIDDAGLNEHLFDLGLLPLAVNLDPKKVPDDFDVSSFLVAQPKVLGVSVNKKGRVPNPGISSHDLEHHIGSYLTSKKVHVFCEAKYERLKERMLQCDVLQKKNKIKHEFGSVYLKEHHHKVFDTLKVLNELGPAFLMEYGSPNLGAINECIMKGRIHPNEVAQFKRVIDYRLDMVILTQESNQKMFDHMQRRTRIISANLGA